MSGDGPLPTLEQLLDGACAEFAADLDRWDCAEQLLSKLDLRITALARKDTPDAPAA